MEIMKNLAENNLAISVLTQTIKKLHKDMSMGFIFTSISLFATYKVLKIQDEQIKELKAEIEEMKSKGE